MKRSILVIIGFLLGTIIGAQSIWTGNAAVGNSSDFPGNSAVARAKSSTFPTGTLLRVNNPKTGKFVEVEVIGRLGTPGVLILVEQSAGSVIGLPSDHVFPVRVSPVSTGQARRSMPMVLLDEERSSDPDINPLAAIGDESAILSEGIAPDPDEAAVLEEIEKEPEEDTVPETLALETKIEPEVEDPEEELSDVFVAELNAESEVDSHEDSIESDEDAAVFIEEDLEQTSAGSPRNSGFSRELAGELAEVPVHDYDEAIEGEYREFALTETVVFDDAADETASVPPYEGSVEEKTRFVYGLEEDKTALDTKKGHRDSAEPPPVEDVAVIDEKPHLVDGGPPVHDDDALMIFPPMLDDGLPEADGNSYLVDDLPAETAVMAPIVDDNPPPAEVFTPVKDAETAVMAPIADDNPPPAEVFTPVKDAETAVMAPIADDNPPSAEVFTPVKDAETAVMAPIADDNPPSAEVFTPVKDAETAVVAPVDDNPPSVEVFTPVKDDESLVADGEKDESLVADAEEEAAIPEEHGIYFLTSADLMPPEPEDAAIEDSIDAVEDNAPVENMALAEDSAITDEESLYPAETGILNEDELLSADETSVKEDIDSVEGEIASGQKWIQEFALTPVSLEIGNHYVQIGTYRNIDVLKAAINELKTASPWYPLSYEFSEDKGLYRLLIGPLRPAEKGAVLRTIRSTLTSDAFHYTPP